MTLQFGTLVSEARGDDAAMKDWLALVEGLLDERVALVRFGSYDDLAGALEAAAIDLAWLPPLLFTGLEKRGAIVPIVGLRGDAVYMSALVARSDSCVKTSAELAGTRVAWVDRWSASGYVAPRIALAGEGVDPRALFSSERFFGSHEAVVRAVLDGSADVGATYASADDGGRVLRGAWSDLAPARALRVVASWGPLPSDVIAARASLGEDAASAVRRALLSVARHPTARNALLRATGASSLDPWVSASYEAMRGAMTEAAKRGLLDELLR